MQKGGEFLTEQLVDKVLLESDFSIQHLENTPHFMDHPHFHDGYEIHYVFIGNPELYIDERLYYGEPGTLTVINSNEIHRVVIEENEYYERYYIHFKPRFIQETIEKYPEITMLFSMRSTGFENCVQLSSENQILFREILNQLAQLYHGEDTYLKELKIKNKLLELLLFLNEQFLEVTNFRISETYKGQELLEEISQYIKQNYNEEISLDLLCQKFFVSKSTILRMFKKTFGITPTQYLIYQRIMNSRHFLKKGYPVKEVAEIVGYKDVSSYIKMFKAIQGLSPKTYSKKSKEIF